MTRFKHLVATALSMAALSACNTVAGAGRDLQVAGRAIDHTADEVSDFLFEPDGQATTASAETDCDSGAKALKGKSSKPACR